MNEPVGQAYLVAGAEPAQREAVTAGEPLVVVGAGAGTGKTRTLAWRFCWLVATGRARAADILTLTFTEKAAREMADRILDTLKAWENLAVEAGDGLTAGRLREAWKNSDQLTVSTIHAFAYQVVQRGSFVLPHRGPVNRVVSAPEEAAFWVDAADALDAGDTGWFLSGLPVSWQGREHLFTGQEWEELVDEFAPIVLIEGARQAIESFASRGLTPEQLWEWGENPEIPDRQVASTVFGLFLPAWEQECARWLVDILPFLDLGASDHRVSRVFSVLRSQFSWPLDPPGAARFLTRFSEEVSGITRSHRQVHYQEAQRLLAETGGGDNLATYRRELDRQWGSALCFVLKDPLLEKDRKMRGLLLMASALIWKRWEEHKRRESLLDFSDQILFARQIVVRSPLFTSRFTHVLVDEFQDTDHLQDDLVRSILRHNQGHLFVVGDLKQSIYRFRHADFSLFGRYLQEAELGEKGRVVYLDRSYRSTPTLLDELNSLFSHLWQDGLSYRVNHPYRPLNGVLPRPPVDRPVEILFTFRSPENELPVADARASLARALGEKMAALRDRGECSWRDIAVLCPTRTSFAALEEVLVQEMGLPVSFLSNVSYFRRSETGDAVALLRFLSNPADAFSLASFLSSPFSLAPLERVHAFLKEKTGDLTNQDNEVFRTYFPELAEKIDRWQALARLEGPAAVLSRLLEETKAFRSYPARLRRRAYLNICRAIDIAREYQQVRGKDLAGCANYLERAARLGERREEVIPIGEQEDVVRVMTIHAAKGLEFPVVALFGLENQPGSSHQSSILASNTLGITASRFPSVWQEKKAPLSWDLSRELEARDEREERERVFYVACTRARKKLYLCGICRLDQAGRPTPPASSPLAGVVDWLETVKGMTVQHCAIEPPGPLKKPVPAGGSPREPATELLLSPGPVGSLESLSATSYALYRFCPYAWRLRFRQGVPLVWELPADDQAGGADLGTVIHWVMSRWDYERSSLDRFFPLRPSRDEEHDQVPDWLFPLWPEPKEWEEARGWLESLAGGATGFDLREAQKTGRLEREVPFRFSLSSETKGVGVIDALISRDDSVRILDHKITRMEQAPPGLFQHQLLFYGMAVRRFYPGRKVILQGVFLREGKLEEIPLPLSWKTLEQEMLDVALHAVRGPFQPNHANCPTCPWRSRCRRAHPV